MDQIVKTISKKYPCREKLIQQLYSYISDHDQMSDSLYLYGQSGIGKSIIVNEFLNLNECVDHFVIINCVECYSPEILYETILNELNEYEFLEENNFKSTIKCKNMMHFVRYLKELNNSKIYVIVLENAEELRDMEYNVLPCFLKLQQLTKINICTILLSTISFEKYHSKVGVFDAITIYVEPYTKAEMSKVLLVEYDNVQNGFICKIKSNEKLLDFEVKKQIKILKSLDQSFYENYISVMLTVFFRISRDVNELKTIATFCFERYISPVLEEKIDKNDVSKLWKNITQTFLNVLRNVQVGMYQIDEQHSILDQHSTQSNSNQIQLTQLELPYYTKFLLIAAFLASNNNPKDDKRLFMKNAGKSKKKSQKLTAKVTEKMITQLGPQSFSIDRLLAIFYAILDEKVDLNAKLLSQISNLAHLRLLRFVSGENNLLEGTSRLQCTIGLDFILHVGRTVGFNVRQYLCDFL